MLFNSCNSCTNSAHYVVSFVEKDKLLPVNYLPTDLTGAGVNSNTAYNLVCMGNGTFGGQTLTVIANCAKVVGRIIGAATFHCVQCKPGFYPTRDANNPGTITACTAFTNCQVSSAVGNICSECKPGFYFKYDSSKFSVGYEQDCDNTPSG